MSEAEFRSVINEQLTALAHQVKALKEEEYARNAPKLIRRAEIAILDKVPDRLERVQEHWPEAKTIQKLDNEPWPSFTRNWSKEKPQTKEKQQEIKPKKKGPDRGR